MFRNKEFRRFALLFAAVTLAAAGAGFSIGLLSGILTLAYAAVLGGAFYLFTRARYRSIARLSEQIDVVLHDADRLCVAEAEEGELAVLQSEIAKATLRIREQNHALQKERARLADAMADVAHQLRTPLTSANLILSLLKDAPDQERRRALLREAGALFAQMDWLITSLLQLSRLDAGMVAFQSREVSVEALLDAAARPLLIPLELHDVALRKVVPEGAALVGDPGWLAEAIRNILKNCMESAGGGGWIAVACTDNPLYTELTVRDSGKGFSKEDLPRLFERFYRGKNRDAAGYGVGLALSRAIVARQGGTLTAKNHPEGGALFTLRFPK